MHAAAETPMPMPLRSSAVRKVCGSLAPYANLTYVREGDALVKRKQLMSSNKRLQLVFAVHVSQHVQLVLAVWVTTNSEVFSPPRHAPAIDMTVATAVLTSR